LIYVFATHVNRSENRKIDQFTALHRYVCAQKLSRAFVMTVWMSYISCSVCAKTLLSFCVYEQRLCHVFAMYVIAMHVNRSDNAKNRSIYCILQACRCAKAESCLCNVCVNVMYELNADSSAVTALCVIAMCVNRPENEKNQSICCITQVYRCTKAESCLRNVCVCDVYELQRMRKDVAVILCIWAKTVSCLRIHW